MNAKDTRPVVNVGFPISSLLGVAFVVMKLGGWGAVANWSWWWVTVPFWGPVSILIGFWLLFIVIYFLGLGIVTLLDNRK